MPPKGNKQGDKSGDKKDRKPDASEGRNHFEELIALLFVLAFIVAIWNRINYLVSIHNGQSLWLKIYLYFIYNIWPAWKVIALFISGLCIVGIFFVYQDYSAINKEERGIYGAKKIEDEEGKIEEVKNEKWQRVLEHLNSANSSDWKLAIIEADIMLDELLKVAGFHGETIGERLKSVEPSEMLTLEEAWEAHKVRNAIAHRGSDFPINEREVKHAVSLYESVFKEFKVI